MKTRISTSDETWIIDRLAALADAMDDPPHTPPRPRPLVAEPGIVEPRRKHLGLVAVGCLVMIVFTGWVATTIITRHPSQVQMRTRPQTTSQAVPTSDPESTIPPSTPSTGPQPVSRQTAASLAFAKDITDYVRRTFHITLDLIPGSSRQTSWAAHAPGTAEPSGWGAEFATRTGQRLTVTAAHGLAGMTAQDLIPGVAYAYQTEPAPAGLSAYGHTDGITVKGAVVDLDAPQPFVIDITSQPAVGLTQAQLAAIATSLEPRWVSR